MKNRELFTLCVAFVGVGAAYVTASFGLSLALGTFLAGLVISESEYGLQAVSDVRPFRDTFSGIFFISVGMLLNVGFVSAAPGLVVGVAGAILLLKIAVTTGPVLTLKRSFQTSLISGISVAQVGEFSFILASVAAPMGLFVDNDLPAVHLLVRADDDVDAFSRRGGGSGERAIAQFLGVPEVSLEQAEQAELADLRDHAIIVGYGLSGSWVAELMPWLPTW